MTKSLQHTDAICHGHPAHDPQSLEHSVLSEHDRVEAALTVRPLTPGGSHTYCCDMHQSHTRTHTRAHTLAETRSYPAHTDLTTDKQTCK